MGCSGCNKKGLKKARPKKDKEAFIIKAAKWIKKKN